MSLTPIDDALRRIRRGEMVLVVDDEDRENEGDLQMAARLRDGRGAQLHVPVGAGARVHAVRRHVARQARASARWCRAGQAGCDTAFTVTIDHRDAGSGIGAADRALTIRRFLDPRSRPEDFIRPGHVFPLRALRRRRARTAWPHRGGGRPGSPRGLAPVAVTCEVLHDDGSPARLPYLELFAQEHRIAMISVEQIAEYRLGDRRRRHVDSVRCCSDCARQGAVRCA